MKKTSFILFYSALSKFWVAGPLQARHIDFNAVKIGKNTVVCITWIFTQTRTALGGINYTKFLLSHFENFSLMDEEVSDRLNLKSLCLRAITVNYFHQNKNLFSKCDDSKKLMKRAQWGLKLPTEFRIKVLQAVNQTCHELSRWTEKHSALFSDKRQNRVRHFKLYYCRNLKIPEPRNWQRFEKNVHFKPLTLQEAIAHRFAIRYMIRIIFQNDTVVLFFSGSKRLKP